MLLSEVLGLASSISNFFGQFRFFLTSRASPLSSIFYFGCSGPKERHVSMKFSLRLVLKNLLFSDFFEEIQGFEVENQGLKTYSSQKLPFGKKTHKTAGYHRNILRIPIFVNKAFKKMKTFFSLEKALFLHHSF